MIRVTRSGAATVLVALMVFATLAGCAGIAPPTGEPSIRGVITTITPGEGSLGAVLVEETSAQGLSFDKASLAITKDTKILRGAAGSFERIAFADLTKGMLVEVWVTGPVRESYPVQADADTIVVLK